MRAVKFITLGLAAALLTTTAATLLPAQALAGDGYRSAATVAVGYRGHRGYDDRHRHKHHHHGHAPYGRAYGYYAPRYPAPYYHRPYYRYYPRPYSYDYGRSGWEIDLRYYYRD